MRHMRHMYILHNHIPINTRSSIKKNEPLKKPIYRWTGWVWGIPVEVQDLRKITYHFKEIYTIYPKSIKRKPKMPTCNRLDLETLGSRPTMAKNLPWHWHVTSQSSEQLVIKKKRKEKKRKVTISKTHLQWMGNHRWTGGAWEITGSSSTLEGKNYPSFRNRIYKNIPQIDKTKNRKIATRNRWDVGNTKNFTHYALNLSPHITVIL